MKKQQTECSACDGTGLYCGFAEPPGVAVVCIYCGGSGATPCGGSAPFTGRKRRDDVRTVKLSRGSFLATGIGPYGRGITYEEFMAGKMPKEQ